ncbi:hypothetical protein WMF20_18500 [Sorangium sp. So ce834]|uniref:hypothetical protein n=1 Tax=Sorangium sp. So ce834 TaxID=3133321 RepID=UPI003F62F141
MAAAETTAATGKASAAAMEGTTRKGAARGHYGGGERLPGQLRGGIIAASAEVARSEVPWGDKDVYLVRLPFDQEEAPVADGVIPMHNLIETSAMTRQLTAEKPPSIWLVCADVALSDLAPSELDPGAAAWGPTYFGVRIGRLR